MHALRGLEGIFEALDLTIASSQAMRHGGAGGFIFGVGVPGMAHMRGNAM